MKNPVYMNDIESCYKREMYAKVEKVIDRDGEVFITLDKTIFYPVGGGQPSDTGMISWKDGRSKVLEAKKEKEIIHRLEGDIPDEGEEVHLELDWDRRYAHMRMHTAQHLISAVVWEKFQATTVGNQIHADRSHIDFQPADFKMEDLKEIQEEMNRLIEEGVDVKVSFQPRDNLEKEIDGERVDLSRLPKSVNELRVIEIENGEQVDICPCAGTHVGNLKEIGRVNIVKRKSKGKGKVRVTYKLD